MNVGPYMAYILYIWVFFILYTKKRGFGGPKNFHHKFLPFFAILAIKMADFFKLLFLRPSLKTRSHDRPAHTFGSSQRFLEVPQKGVLKHYVLAFFYQIHKYSI